MLAEVRELVGDDIEIEVMHRDIGLENPFAGALVEAMVATLERHDPGAPVLPYLLSRRHRQQGARRSSASPATASRRCSCRPTSTSRRCSTASTSACRSTH